MRLFASAFGFGLALMIPCVASATRVVPLVAFRPTMAEGGTAASGTSSPSPGDQVQTAVGQIRTVDRVGVAAINQQLPSTVFSGVGGEDGWRTPLNAQNQLVMTISFTDNSQGVYVVTIPEPSAGGAAVGLTCFGLLRRVPGLSGRRERAE